MTKKEAKEKIGTVITLMDTISDYRMLTEEMMEELEKSENRRELIEEQKETMEHQIEVLSKHLSEYRKSEKSYQRLLNESSRLTSNLKIAMQENEQLRALNGKLRQQIEAYRNQR